LGLSESAAVEPWHFNQLIVFIDQATRQAGEQAIKQMRDQDPKKFLASLTKEVTNDELEESSR